MGTDIHGYAEWRWRDSDNPNAWGVIAPVPDIRNYRVFELLANISPSGDIVHLFSDDIPHRGLPEGFGVSEQGRLTSDDYGDHGFTWYTLEEIDRSKMWDQIEHEVSREAWKAFITYLRWFKKGWHDCDVRIVIGFDS